MTRCSQALFTLRSFSLSPLSLPLSSLFLPLAHSSSHSRFFPPQFLSPSHFLLFSPSPLPFFPPPLSLPSLYLAAPPSRPLASHFPK